MRAIFAHDHIFRIDENGNLYTGGSFNHNVWNRYLEVFDEIIVIARLKPISENEKKSNLNEFNLKNVKFVEIPNISSIKGKMKYTKIAKEKIDSIMKNDLDILISRLPSEIGSLAIDVAKKYNKPYLIEMVACPWDALWNYGNIKGKLYAPYKSLETKLKVKKASNVIYVTNKFLQKRYPNNNNNIGCSDVEIIKIEEDVLVDRIRKIESKTSGEFNIGLIGGLSTGAKGFDVAIKSIKLVKEKYPNIKLKILGPGSSDKWQLLADELGVKDNIEFCGTLKSGEEVYKWIDKLDIYIQPSYQEGLPRAVIEAMSRACLVIGSTAGGIPELIDSE